MRYDSWSKSGIRLSRNRWLWVIFKFILLEAFSDAFFVHFCNSWQEFSSDVSSLCDSWASGKHLNHISCFWWLQRSRACDSWALGVQALRVVEQEVQLSRSDRATRYVSWNLVNRGTTMQKLHLKKIVTAEGQGHMTLTTSIWGSMIKFDINLHVYKFWRHLAIPEIKKLDQKYVMCDLGN